MDKYIVIDSKMRNVEKEYLKSLGYRVINIQTSKNVYYEISSHVDIFGCKIKDKIVVEPSVYSYLKEEKYDLENVICGKNKVGLKYPLDVLYNVCCIGENVIHNFKYTDEKILEIIQNEKLNMININQGYSNCSIAVIDDKSVVVTDKKIAEKLIENDIDVLLLEENLDIKLLKNDGKYSKMNGFIGGCMARIENKIIIFGDISKIDRDNKIQKFIQSRNLELVSFKGVDVVDYGGILII